jgi:integrase/recombinase XerD
MSSDDDSSPHSPGQRDTDDARAALATAFETDLDPLAQYADAFAVLDGTAALLDDNDDRHACDRDCDHNRDCDCDQPSGDAPERSRPPSDGSDSTGASAPATTLPHVDPFDLFSERVLDERDPAVSTRRGYRRAIAQWRTYMAMCGRHPACPNVTHVRGFAQWRQADHGNQPTTILTKLHRLHAVFQYWQADPVFPHSRAYDPFALALSTLDLERASQREYPWIALETLRAVVDDIVHVHARALVVSQLKLGVRASEVCNLQLRDLNLAETACQRWYAELGTQPHVTDRLNAVYVAPAHERDGNKSA